MDISSSLQSCKNIIETIKGFPKHKRYPLVIEWHPKKNLEITHSEILRKCIPFINKIIKDLKNSLNSSQQCSLEEILSRKAYIQKKLEEAKHLQEIQSRRSHIIKEIDKLEKMGIPKSEKIILDEKTSNLLIEYLFENELNTDASFKSRIEDFIELTFDRNANKKTDAYDKILQLFQ